MGTIKLKRGQSQNLGTLTLEAGEPAFSLDTGKLYVGNGTDKILINPDLEHARTASKLQTPRRISLTGDVSGTVQFDGSSDVSILATYIKSGVTAGTYPKVTVDAKGNVTAGANLTASDIPTLTLSKISDAGTASSKNVGTASGNIPVLDASGKLSAGVLPNSPVQSVAGKTGVVTLVANDVGLGKVTNESKVTMFTSPTFTGSPTAPTPTASDNTTKIATTAFVKSQGYINASSTIDGGTF